jgi:integrase
MIDAYQRSPEWLALAPATRSIASIYLRDLYKMRDTAAGAVTRRDLLDMRDAIATTRGNGAATGFIRAASSCLSWAVDREWIPHNPAHRIKALPAGELRAWTAAEADAAERLLPPHLARVVILARYTGQRRGDLIALTWAAYDGRTIRVRQHKTGESLTIPCHPRLAAALDEWPRDAVTILTDARGRPWKAQDLSHAMPKALAAAGLASDINVHGLRKLAATSIADAGGSTHEIAAITGHRTLAMVQHYTRSADQERLAGAAIVRLSGVRTNLDKRKKTQGNQ